VLVQIAMSQDKDPNQGEGDRISARRYDRNVREFIDQGKVPDAAADARQYVDREPDQAMKAENMAKRGPGGHQSTVEGLIAKGHSVIDRLRPRVDRALGSLKARFGRK
jgi:hypothetical protein